MAKILVWMSPEPGHVLPTIKFAKDLKKAGHKVVYQSPESQRIEVEELGFETIGFFDNVERQFKTSLHNPSPAASWHYRAIAKRYPGPAYPRAVREELLRAAISVNADLLVIDGIFDRLLGLEMHNVLPEHCSVVRVYINLPFERLDAEVLSRERGPIVFLSPKQFELPFLWYENAFYTEGSAFEGKEFAEFSLPAVGQVQGTVYCSFGSQIERYPDAEATFAKVIAAAATLDTLLFVVNAGILAAKLQHLERSNVLIRPRVPQRWLLQKASAMVLHGGFGSVKDCIYHQVPMLILGQKWDQPMNGARVEYHGLGLSLDPKKTTESSIAESVHSLLENKTFARNLESMRQIFLDCDSKQPTARLLERILNREDLYVDSLVRQEKEQKS